MEREGHTREGETLVQSILNDLESSTFPEPEKQLLRFTRKVNSDSPHIGPADFEALHQSGWSDEAIWYAITVCSLFNFYNRWIDATGVHPLSSEAHRKGGIRSADSGYVRR